MLKKRYLLIFCLILFIVSVVGVSAAEDTNQTITDDTNNVINNGDTISVSLSDDEIQGSADNGTFTDLQKKINEASEGSIIYLENNYVYDSEFSTNGITINKKLTINGNGYTIDALGKTRIFNVTGNNVILKDIYFTNGTATDGGAIYWQGDGGFIVNCHFVSNLARSYSLESAYCTGGAVYCFGNNISIISSVFKNNYASSSSDSASSDGGAVYCYGNNILFVNSVFKGNGVSSRGEANGGASSSGGAISFNYRSEKVSITNCTFEKNYVQSSFSSGGAIYGSVNITNSSFIDNYAYSSGYYSTYSMGGAICGRSNVTNSIFKNNFVKSYKFKEQRGYYLSVSSYSYGGAISDGGDINNCSFINCSALSICVFSNSFPSGTASSLSYGGAIYLSGDINNCSFIDNKAQSISSGDVFIFVDGDIAKSYSLSYGGAIYLNGNNQSITNCVFNNSLANSTFLRYNYYKILPHSCGGAIYLGGTNHSIINCSFNDSFSFSIGVAEKGSAIYWGCENGNIFNSTFKNTDLNECDCVIHIQSSVNLNNNSLNNNYIYNGGNILSKTVIVVLENKTAYFPKNEVDLSAEILDDNGNNIVCDNFTFIISGKENKSINASLDNSKFKANIILNEGNYSVNTTVLNEKFSNNSFKTGLVIVRKPDFNSSVTIKTIDGLVYGDSLFVDFDVENRTDVRVIIIDSYNNEVYNQFVSSNNITVNNLNAGIYTISVYNLGNIKYNSSSDSKDFLIDKANSLLTINDIDFLSYGSESVINFDVVNRTIVDYVLENRGEVIKEGSVLSSYVNLGILDINYYSIRITNAETDNYKSSSDTKFFYVVKAGSLVSIHDIEDITYGSESIIDFDVINASRVNYVLEKDGEVISEGSVSHNSIPFGVLDVGSYSITVTNVGNKNYESSSDIKTFNVVKANSLVSIYDIDDIVYGSESVVLYDVVNKTSVTYVLKKDGEVIIEGSDSYGYIDFGVLDVGSYSITVTNVGNKNYESSSDIKTFNVVKANSLVSIYDIDDIVYGSESVVLYDVVNRTIVDYVLKKEGKIMEGSVLSSYGYIDFGVLDVGSYSITVTNAGNDNYKSSSDTKTFNVNKAQSEINIDIGDFDVDSSYLAIIELNYDATGEVIIYVDGNKVGTETISYGQVEYMVQGLNKGQHTIEAVYNGDDHYFGNSTSAIFNINPLVSYINIESNELVQGEDLVFYVPYDATGTITLSINSKTYNLPIMNSKTLFNTAILSPGDYPIKVYYSGDNRYSGCELTSAIKINADCIIDAPELVKYYHGSERFVVTLTDNMGNPIPNEAVIITVNGGQYTRTTNLEGTASLAINMNAGVYDVVVACDDINVNSKVTVLSTVHGNDIVKVYGNNTHYYATFLDSEGNYLSKGIFVQFNLNGVYYNKEIIDNEGTAKLDINEKPGKYVITAINPVNSEMTSNTITVLSNIAENSDLTKYYNGPNRFSVRVLSPTGSYASDQKVKFTIGTDSYESTSDSNGYAYLNTRLQPGNYIVKTSYNGNEVSNVIKIIATLNKIDVSSFDINQGEVETIKVNLPSDATGKVSTTINGKEYSVNINNGVGNIILPDLKSGNYNVEVVYSGDSKYNFLKGTTSFVVEKTVDLSAPDVVKYFGGSERFIVTLKDRNGQPITNANIKISLNGVSYARSTNNMGSTSMAINLNSGKYNITTEYDGIKVYSTVTVKDTVISNDFTKIFRNNTQYYAIFVDSQGNVLKNTPVRLNINGVYYTRTTSDQGIAKMNINLNPGTYILTAENPASGEQHTTVIKVLPSIVENHDLTKFYKNESKYTLRILGGNGKPVGEGVTVKLNINGVFYERKTNASGYMNMNINLIPGTYIVTAEYNGLRASNTVKVLPILSAKNVNMKYRDGTKFEAKLLNGKGNPFANQKITFNINGVFYERITDANGIARLNINLMAGEYIITSMYENGAATSNKVTIRS